MSEQRWELYVCPECGHTRLYGHPIGSPTCNRAEWNGTTEEWTKSCRRVPMTRVEVVPRSELQRLRSSVEEIAAVLGTGDCDQSDCEGCQHEMREAVRIAQEALSRA